MEEVDNKAQWDKILQDNLKVAANFHLVFTSDQGQEVMAHLMAMASESVLSPNALFDCKAELNPSDCTFIREGQNQVVRYIQRLMKFYAENK